MASERELGRRALLGAWVPLLRELHHGARFAGLLGSAIGSHTRLTVLLARRTSIEPWDILIDSDDGRYDALTPLIPAATWYERAIADLHGVVPEGHPRPDPLVFHVEEGEPRPRPGMVTDGDYPLHEEVLKPHVHGEGMFLVTYGPVRMGVTESMEYLVETPGEDIAHLRLRVLAKHRGVQARFTGATIENGVLLAERAEGIASVAHALAYSQAVERAVDAVPPVAALLTRSLYAELERIANHVDVAMKLSDAAGLGVATARLGVHKERVLRLTSRMCGSRFGRGVVVPGGVTALPELGRGEFRAALDTLSSGLAPDLVMLGRTPSFLDRVRGAGRLDPELAQQARALGPVGRGSGVDDDNRLTRPYAAYPQLSLTARLREEGDSHARLGVRLDEIGDSIRMLRELADLLDDADPDRIRTTVPEVDGRALGWAEAPQGEVVYDVEVTRGHVARACPRSASFHNLALFHDVFHGDVFTDFPFIEASFGLSVAGVAL